MVSYFCKNVDPEIPIVECKAEEYHKVSKSGACQGHSFNGRKEKEKIQQVVQQQRKSLFDLSSPLSPASVNASPPAQSLNINFAQHTQGNLFTS